MMLGLLSDFKVDLAHRGESALAARLPVLMRRLGEAHVAAGQLEDAEIALQEVLKYPLDPGENHRDDQSWP